MNSTGAFLDVFFLSYSNPVQACGEGEKRKQDGIKVKKSLQDATQVP